MRHIWILQGIFIFLIMTVTGCDKDNGQQNFVGQMESLEAYVTEDVVPIYFFHDTACGNCDGTEEFLKIVTEQIADLRELYPYELHIYNVFKNDGREAAEKIFDENSLKESQIRYPALLIKGELYEGMDEIRNNLLKSYLKEAESIAIYFYRDDCKECNDVKIFMDNLPDTIFINGTEVPFRLIQLNSREGDNGEKIRQLFTEYDVPEEEQMVPFVFLKDDYLAGKDEIEKNLMSQLEQGEGLGTAFGKNKK